MSTHLPSSAPARRLRVSRPIVAAAIAIAALLASALPVAAEAPFVASPYVGDSQVLTVGADGALWSVQSVDPTVLRRTLPDGTHTFVTLPNGAGAADLAPGIGGDAVWAADFGKAHRITAAGAVTTVTLPDSVLVPYLEPSVSGDRMWFVADTAETGQNEHTWGVGNIDTTGAVAFSRSQRYSEFSIPGELVTGPQGTRWTIITRHTTTELARVEDDFTVTRFPTLATTVGGAVLGPDGLLWVSVSRPDGPAVLRLRADGSVASTVRLPVAAGAAVVGPDGAVYFAVERGYLRVTTDGQVRPVLAAGDTGDYFPHTPAESASFAGDIYFASGWDLNKLDLDGRTVPSVATQLTNRADGTVTVTVSVTGGSAPATGTVTVVEIFCCYHGMANAERTASAALDAAGRASLTFRPGQLTTAFHVDYSGDTRYLGTATLDSPLEADSRSETERYIAQTYADLLNRQPEPAGLQYWTGELGRGTPRTAVSYALAISSEHRERFVDALFQDYLNRSAERAGRDSFVSDLSRGATMNQIRASILGSQEYSVRFGRGTVDGYITALYQEVLNRQPDAQGRAFWSGELARGVSKPTMASALLSSQEALRRLVDARFQQLLRRSVDTGGRDYWVSLLQRGFREERLIAELIGSDEYYRAAVAGRY